MNKVVKYSIIIISSILIIYLSIKSFQFIQGVVILGGLTPFKPNEKQMGRYFQENAGELSYVADALSKLPYEDIRFDKVDGSNTMYASNPDGNLGKNMPISDTILSDKIGKLYEIGFEVIEKEDGTYIEFSKWSALNESRGIVYSINGKTPDFNFIVEIKPLSQTDWYYYESNFEVWKTRNQQQKE